MCPVRSTLVVALVALGTSTPQASAQSVQEVVDGMYAAFERQAEGIDDYTLVQSVMGFDATSYFEKETADGRSTFRMKESDAEGLGMSFGDEDAGLGELHSIGPELVEHGRYAGREQIDGTQVHVIVVDDITQLDLATPEGPEEMEFTPKSGRFFIDAERMVARRIEIDGEGHAENGPQPIAMRMDLLDYRSVEGLLVPYRTVVTIEGLQAMMDPEMQAQLEEMERQLEQMPESQRAMMERMMGETLERMKQMMGDDGEPMVIEVTVSDVRVNTGPPGA